ncbi:calcium-binding mitochondrial carrier protein SCaMC-1-like [Haliotis rufescens]|uniref:calcium-binding mitochondrial carrier protein SCaMC-1-like n=1 Tax=Haliotis rufescens TaxID=6454 RepID=UPI00201EC173|nr:calcium-binding mitochondrial carrier protein SCaMC-1-like [Haliotis rufescens]
MGSLFMCVFALVLSVAYSQSVTDLANGVFHSLDANKDGTLELGELEGYFNTGDIDGDGKISKSDFLTLLQGNKVFAEKEFAKYDANSDGTITLDDVKLIFNQLDVDSDGKVTQVEFQAKYPTVLMIHVNAGTPVGK